MITFRKISVIAPVVLALMVPQTTMAQWTSSRPDGHAPIGVMGDHRHEGGEVMLSYRFMYMNMNGSRDGTDALTDGEIVSPTGYNFMVTPTKMPMMMHMFGAMYAPVDAFTLMVMVPLLSSEMDHITRASGTSENPAFTTSSAGFGDIKIGTLIGLGAFGNQAVHANLTVGIPTGSIEETDVLPPTGNPDPLQLPYPMQLGSGTVDITPGLTYLGQAGDWSWGGQATGTFRIGDNDRSYTLGNEYMGTFWGARRFGRYFSASVRLEGNRNENIDGADPAPSVNPAVVPTADPDLRAGTRLDVGIGFNIYFPDANAFRIAIEAFGPLYQDLTGPQLETDWRLVLGSQVTFHLN